MLEHCWGSRPAHLMTEEIARCLLKRIEPIGFDQMTGRLVLGVAHSTERSLGSAWMDDRLIGNRQ